MERTRDVVGASVYGVFSIAMIQGTLGGLAFWILGCLQRCLGCGHGFLSMIPSWEHSSSGFRRDLSRRHRSLG